MIDVEYMRVLSNKEGMGITGRFRKREPIPAYSSLLDGELI